MNELRVDIGGSTRGFQIATDETRRMARQMQGDLSSNFSNIGGMAEHAAGRPARMLHKAFEQITEASPVAGMAIRMAFSPLAGIIGLATAAVMSFRQEQEEAAAAAKKAAQESRDAWVETQEAMFSKDPAKAFAGRTKRDTLAAAKAEPAPELETATGQAKKIAGNWNPFSWGFLLANGYAVMLRRSRLKRSCRSASGLAEPQRLGLYAVNKKLSSRKGRRRSRRKRRKSA